MTTTELLEKFKDTLKEYNSNRYSSYYPINIVAAATPGIDSVVMCHLLKESGSLKGIVHCNYGLRKDSDGDENFVRAMAEKLEVPFYSKRFDTRRYAHRWDATLQVAARRLRYAFLEEIRHEARVEYVATAVNGEEALGLFFINIAKGNGLLGLAGPLPRMRHLLRPMLFFYKQEILDYATELGLDYWPDHHEFHEDASHDKVREHVLPAMQALNPHFMKGMKETLVRWHQAASMHDNQYRQRNLSWDRWRKQIEFKTYGFPNDQAYAESLYQSIKDYGFTYEQADKVMKTVRNTSHYAEKTISLASPTHRLEYNIYLHIYQIDDSVIYLESVADSPYQASNGVLLFRFLKEKPAYSTSQFGSTIYLDADKLTWPLLLRRWRPDDLFESPTSHTHPQTLDVYFANRKVSAPGRDDYWVVWSGNQICGIACYQEDRRFMAQTNTKNILALTFHSRVDADQEY